MCVLKCPVCDDKLYFELNRYLCKNNHSYDVSKKGYVNLLMSNVSGEKRHGDDKMMAEARRDFLNLGYYAPLSKKIVELSSKCDVPSPNIFECGCGDCYYINEVKKAFNENNKKCYIYGADISKEVLPFGKKRCGDINLFVASAYKLPIMSDSIDIVLSVFAPLDFNEASRIMKKGGLLIKVIPLEDHLIELKKQLYKDVYLNRPVVEKNDSFEYKKYEKLEYTFNLKNSLEIDALFKMTPYYYKTSEVAQKKIRSLDSLSVTASFGVSLYVKI